MLKSIIIILFAVIIFSGCGVFIPMNKTKDKLSDLELKMSREQTEKMIGQPDEVRGSVVNENGNEVRVLQYGFYSSSASITNFSLGFFTVTLTWWFPINRFVGKDYYWLYFVEDQLAQWGRAGDWREDFIMKIKLQNE